MRKLFGELGIDVHATEMSMSIHCDECGLEYAGGRGAKGIFAQRRRLFDPRYLRMLLTIKASQRLPMPLQEVYEWQYEGACRDVDPGTFFSPDAERGPRRKARETAAKALCAVCPVVEEAPRLAS